jgi:hypothetical protein
VTSQTLPVNVCSFAHISNHDHLPIQTNDRFWGKQKCNCCGLVCTNQIFIKCMSAKHCIKFPYRFLLPFIPSKYIFNANLHQTYSMFLRLAPSPIEVPSLILVCSPVCAIHIIYIISVYIFQFSSSSKLANMVCPSLQT